MDWLEAGGRAAHLTCEPSDGPVGKLLRKILRHQVQQMDAAAIALLFAADRLHHLQAEILPRLRRGQSVITDRYVYSSLAYQSVDLDQLWVASLNRRAMEPDLTIYLRVTPQQALQRRRHRGADVELFETTPLQERIFAKYEEMFGDTGDGRVVHDGQGWQLRAPNPDVARVQARLDRRPCWAVVDGRLPVDALQLQFRALVESFFQWKHDDEM